MSRRFNPKKKPTKAESAFMDKVAQHPCCECAAYGVQVSHVTEGFRRLGNKYVIPLCPPCHTLVDTKGFEWEMQKCREMYADMGLEFIEPVSKLDYKKSIR